MVRSARPGAAVIDVVAAAFAIVLLLTVLLYYVQQTRTQAHTAGCRDNLRKIGVALAAYSDNFRTLPTVTVVHGTLRILHSPHALLLGYLPKAPHVSYDPTRPWFEQKKGTGGGVIPSFRCPESAHSDPIESRTAQVLKCALGTRLGTTDYIFCKGPNDSWCLAGDQSSVPLQERGAFEIGCPLRAEEIPDGIGETMLVGEGTGGPNWLLAPGVPALNFWCWPFLNTRADRDRTNVPAAGIFGSTVSPLNSRPVIETLADTDKLADCRPSAKGGPHTVSNFRSDHAKGGLFLFADGSARMLSDAIDPRTYRALSTIACSEAAAPEKRF